MNLCTIFLFVWFVTWIKPSASGKDENLLDVKILGVLFKENSYVIKDRKSLEDAAVSSRFFTLDSRREESITQSTYYNESIIVSFLCYGINFTDHHVLTWHHVIGGTEVDTVSLETRTPNNNYTLNLSLGTFDNESVLFCTASVPSTGEIINRTKDLKFQMNEVLTEEFATIAICSGNFSKGSTMVCVIGDHQLGRIEVSQRRKMDYLTTYGYINPANYNKYFPTVTHTCAKGDKSILKTPEGNAQVNANETFTLDKSDNGTIIFCSRFVNILKDLKPNEYKVERETYNERIYVYNELFWKDSYYTVNSINNMLLIGIIVVVMANILAVIFCIRRWIKKRRNLRVRIN